MGNTFTLPCYQTFLNFVSKLVENLQKKTILSIITAKIHALLKQKT
jgi:hypothetical protein